MRRELYNMRVRFIASLIVLVATYTLLILFREKAVEILEGIPGNLKKLAGGEVFLKKLANDEEFYIVSQWYWKNFLEMMPIVAVIIGFPLFSREMEKGTIVFLLSNRTRSRVFLEKLISGLIVTTSISTTCSLLPLLNGLSPKVALGYSVHFTMGSILWFSLAMLLSTFFDDQVKPLLLSLGVLALMITLEGLKICPFGEMAYLSSKGIYEGKGIDVVGTVGHALASLLLISLGFWKFKRLEI